jgi:hypothetical protein
MSAQQPSTAPRNKLHGRKYAIRYLSYVEFWCLDNGSGMGSAPATPELRSRKQHSTEVST